jgi:hypothetical protein
MTWTIELGPNTQNFDLQATTTKVLPELTHDNQQPVTIAINR